ncbi:Rax2 [Kalmanozyma brasiliensis GHG001]|uniref:SH3 domain-containing protein n=1 Tax=Kalmanozyma brasiliensis (strain GHG001) TaxID=1365824 RepID=V5EXX5_KALBG|nr:Rax2 [Kalmanozyma brasiliensis GHG001]EST08468.1 Rax2 [Kalmanozyma brasiliensis GHG001]
MVAQSFAASASISYTHRSHTRPSTSTLARAVSKSALLLTAALPLASASISNFPSIDFDLLGAVSIAGSFAGIQLWNQTGSSTTPNATYDPAASSLLSRASNGTVSFISATEEGGTIHAICQMQSSPNTVFVAGNFFSIGGTAVSNIASYNPTTKAFDSMAGGLDGTVQALYCDNDQQQLIVGGSFSGPVDGKTDRYLGNVAQWDVSASAWNPVSFGGLDGTVNTITAGGNASLVRFGGSFDTRFASAGANGIPSGTNTSASPLTAALTPLSLGQVEFVGGPSSKSAGYDNPAQILCPQGADGSGNSYLFEDGVDGRLTARAFRALNVRAIRLGNTFVDGRGTRTFGIVSIPDNTELELIYLDPATNQNVTCTTNCTLAHDAALPYQDFLIADTPANNAPGGVKELTGIQFTATEYYGAGAGLHVLELLSEGGWAYAYNALNRGGCSSDQSGVSGTDSSATNQGGWYPSTINTLAGTTEPVLAYTDSYSNLQSASSSATVTFAVDIPVNGNYTVNMFVPGCRASGQCGQRTDVQANVFAVEGSQGNLTRVSQTNENDRTVQIYSGEVNKVAEGFQPTVVLSIPSDAPAPSDGGDFTVIADKVSFLLLNSNETLQMARASGFGVLEYNLFDSAVTALQSNGTGTLPNTTMTDIDTFAATLYSNGVRSNASDTAVSAIASVGSRTFVGGSFTSTGNVSFANVAGFSSDSTGRTPIEIANGGLNGPVEALASLGNALYVGGSFTSTADSAVTVSYIARYDPDNNAWTALGGGPDGAVTDLYALGPDALLIAGSFATVNGTGQSGGYAVWNATANGWQTQSSFVAAEMTAAFANYADSNQQGFLAGSVRALSLQSASGAAQLQAPAQSGDLPTIESLNFQFASQSGSSASASSSASLSRRFIVNGVRSQQPQQHQQQRRQAEKRSEDQERASSGLGAKLRSLLARSPSSGRRFEKPSSQASSLTKRAPIMLPASLTSDGQNEVLASAFWQRDDGSFVNILGGNFTTTAGIRNLAFYDDSTSTATAFPAQPITANQQAITVVRSLFVDSDMLYVGGDGGFEAYDLKKASWLTNSAPLSATSRQVLSVTAINHRPDSTQLIVSGSFASAGSLPCLNVCLWDSDGMRWSPLGAGLSGEISAIDYAGNKANQLILAGSLTVNGAQASLASYNFDTQTWTALGTVGSGSNQIPGPATAVSVDDLNANAIFAAGRTADGSGPYLVRWDGTQYTAVGSGQFLSDTGISQLTFVPISRAHPSNPILEDNRLLVVSGALTTQDYGDISSVFFDGQSYSPFLLATNLDGSSGIVRAFTRSTEVLRFPNLHHLAVGLVILISIAIGLGIVFLLVLLGLIWAVARRRPEPRDMAVPLSASDETLGLGEKKRPSSLLATLNAATENAMLGEHGGAAAGMGAAAGAGGATALAAAHRRRDSQQYDTTDELSPSSYHGDASRSGPSAQRQYPADDDGVSDAEAGLGMSMMGVSGAAAAPALHGDEDDSPMEGIPAHARYDFAPNHESELKLVSGEPIEILDDQDRHWWLARNAQGQTGVVPSAYVM